MKRKLLWCFGVVIGRCVRFCCVTGLSVVSKAKELTLNYKDKSICYLKDQLTLGLLCNKLEQRTMWSCTASVWCMKAASNKPEQGHT